MGNLTYVCNGINCDVVIVTTYIDLSLSGSCQASGDYRITPYAIGCVEQSDGTSSTDIECSGNTLTENIYNNTNCAGNVVDTETISFGCGSDGIIYTDFKCSAPTTGKFISYTIFAVLLAYLFQYH